MLWKLEPATAAKHGLYRRYLDAWWPIMLQPAQGGYRQRRVTYLDAFAGPGRYLGGEDGSPLFVLDRLLHHTAVERMQLARERVRLIFIEKDRARFEHLSKELVARFGGLDALPVTVIVRHGDAARLTLPLLSEFDAWSHPIMAIFDSWGNVNVPLSPVVTRIARNQSSEVVVTFGPNWFSRREGENPDELDDVFGGPQFWRPSDPSQATDERWRTWLETYRAALRRAGFAYQLQFMVVPGSGQPLFLVFGTNHKSGVGAMKDAMWSVDGAGGMRFRDPRVKGAVPIGQMDLFDSQGVVDPELLELVHQHLEDKPLTTLAELGEWLLLETARWRSMHASIAVQHLRDEGQVMIEPPRRITRASTIRLA
ncbi:three-Cys-motif partner protein TcmP [Kribbella albertanoniae]|uniref:Three-Cys-motif partner protein TcmP n=1 Tax=Kribbella albertanoniae TaxID=1266829 RepID=A0A4R4Q3U3_9ACTN|nr:three-Cys-motif partner protein TcmP [Kribbella albertanoniae]TDC29746.1 three-Cys-motif partner protein TcmP [Kribbella albertanoniae]